MSRIDLNQLPESPSLIDFFGIGLLAGAGGDACPSIERPHGNDYWIHALGGSWGDVDGQVLSAYYHPTKKHSATTIGLTGKITEVAEAGRWAISHQNKSPTGNKVFYNSDV